MDERRVRWLCRRGMKELDVMLGRYMDARWTQAPAAERDAFVTLLDHQDPDLWQLLMDRDAGRPHEDMDDLIERIRTLSHL